MADTMAPQTTVALNRSGSATALGYVAPHRDDEVATWLRAQRDEVKRQRPGYDRDASLRYDAIDALLDEWKLRADTGLKLADEIPEGA